MDRTSQIQAFRDNAQVGTCGSGQEQAFDALLHALEEMGPGGCNEGFLRAEANLVIIFVSDEEDDSAMPVAEYVAAIGQHKPWGQIRVAAIVGAANGQASRCSIGEGPACGSLCQAPPPSGSHAMCTIQAPACPGDEYCDGSLQQCENPDLRYWQFCDWCSYYNAADCCAALPGSRYVELARAVEAEVTAAREDIPVKNCVGLGTRVACLVDTICQDSFGDTMARIARELMLDESEL
jgi:hypothetical protein